MSQEANYKVLDVTDFHVQKLKTGSIIEEPEPFCHWSEFYFLSLLAAYHVGLIPQPLLTPVAVTSDQQVKEHSWILGKGVQVKGATLPEYWTSPRSVKLGSESTGLVVNGHHKGLIVQRTGETGYVPGRWFGDGLKFIDEGLSSAALKRNQNPNATTQEYILALGKLIKDVQAPHENYNALYERLTANITKQFIGSSAL